MEYDYFVEIRHHRVFCIFCGEILKQEKFSERDGEWYEHPHTHKCSLVKLYNKTQGKYEMSKFTRENQRFFYEGGTIIDKKVPGTVNHLHIYECGNCEEVSSNPDNVFEVIARQHGQEYNKMLFACPKCNVVTYVPR